LIFRFDKKNVIVSERVPRAEVLGKDVPEISEVTTSELKRRHANKSTKDKSKVALVAETNLQTQLRDWHVS